MVKDIPVTLWMGGWRKHLPDLVPEYYDFMRAIVEIVPMAIEEPEGMLADLLLSVNLSLLSKFLNCSVHCRRKNLKSLKSGENLRRRAPLAKSGP